MDILEAINTRKSIRSFKPDAVPLQTLRQIVEAASRAPSWGNTQPWEFAIVGGSKLEEIKRQYTEMADKDSESDISMPGAFTGPYEVRTKDIGRSVFAIRGIERDDKEKRASWKLHGLQNFGAPNVIYILVDRSIYIQGEKENKYSIFDCGLVAENIMLLAVKYGLGTIAQIQAVFYPDVLRKVLGISESKVFVLGFAIGYPDWDDPINEFRSDRVPIDDIAGFYGF